MLVRQGVALWREVCGWKRNQTYLEVLGDLTNEPLEGELPDQELGRLLVPPNFTEGDSSGPETMGLLDTTSRGLQEHCQSVHCLALRNVVGWRGQSRLGSGTGGRSGYEADTATDHPVARQR